MSTYERTHPWLSFALDLSQAPWQMWLLAGEAISKCEHLSGVPLSPEAAAELMKVYLAKGALATTAIEGNTLSEAEARKRVEGIKDLPPSKAYLGVEIDNIIKASNEILDQCKSNTVPDLTPELIKQFNARVLNGLTVDEEIRPGEIRCYSVGVADYRGAPAEDCAELLNKLCDWLRQPWITSLENYSASDRRRLEAILKAVIAHLYLAWIHPFGDGNGRTARLVEFYLLATNGVPFPAAHLLSNHYNETRADYYRQLSMASKTGGKVIPFIVYALADSSINFANKSRLFAMNNSISSGATMSTRFLAIPRRQRRRYLVEDLSDLQQGVAKSKLTDVSVRVLRHYMGKADKTLHRDLAELERLNLVRRDGDRYFANKNLVMAYLPPRREETAT